MTKPYITIYMLNHKVKKVEKFKNMSLTNKIIIACGVVIEEILPLLPPNMKPHRLESGLHLNPEKLRNTLQDLIKEASTHVDTIVLGYGLCSFAVVGLKADNCTLVIPRVDDCIGIFLGSKKRHRDQHMNEPGTYYLTKGWIDAGDTLFEEFKRTEERYGKKVAAVVMRQMLKNYARLVYIDTGLHNKNYYQQYAHYTAKTFNLRFETIKGSTHLINKMLNGPWDDEFIVASPGHTIAFADFGKTQKR